MAIVSASRNNKFNYIADADHLEIMICHYPTGTSNWSPIEHQVFSMTSFNWVGKPLRVLASMTALVRGTDTTTGLSVKASLLPWALPN